VRTGTSVGWAVGRAALTAILAGALGGIVPLSAQDTVRVGITYQPGVRPGLVVLPAPGLDSVRAIVGRDLAVAGFDGIEDAEHTQPPLTTLNQPVYELARRLVSMLLSLLDGEPLAERHILLQPELIVRESTGG